MPSLPPPQNITDVWYHANCPDGFAAALAAWMVLGDKATYQPVAHGDPPPTIVPGCHLAIIDFSYDRDTLLQIHAQTSSLVVLDHHQSAQRELGELDFAHFDLTKSGARLAWEYWHPQKPLPDLFAAIEDRDLWAWKLPESRAVSLALAQIPMDFKVWANLNLEELKVSGRTLIGYQTSLIERALTKTHWITLAGYSIPACNSSLFASELGDILCQRYPQAPFAAVYSVKGNSIAWSLRSVGDFDVSPIATSFGGGGHRNASGFATPTAEGLPSLTLAPAL